MRPHIQNQVQFDQTKKVDYVKLIFLSVFIVAIIGVAIVVYVYFIPKKASCGDNVCASSENCYDCPKDCACASNSYCDSKSKKCVVPRCGNGICEPGENIVNCCNDCGCSSTYEKCNTTTHVCAVPEVAISDEKVKELATEYFTNMSKTISGFGVISSTIYQGKPAKSIGVILQGDSSSHLIIVTEDYQVLERPTN